MSGRRRLALVAAVTAAVFATGYAIGSSLVVCEQRRRGPGPARPDG